MGISTICWLRPRPVVFFIYAPQTSTNIGSWNTTVIGNSMRMAANVLDQYNIDPDRVYVSGLSLGGGATWQAVSLYSGAMAAAVPICGVSGGSNFIPARLVDKPIWAYHASNDSTVTVGRSRSAVNDILAARPEALINFSQAQSGSPFYGDSTKYYDKGTLRYSEFATGGHFIWARAYNESWMYDWLLSQTTDTLMQIGEELIVDFGNTETTGNDSLGRFNNSTRFGLHDTQGTVIPFAKTTSGRNTRTAVLVDAPFANHSSGGLSAGAPFDAGVAADGWITGADGSGRIRLNGLYPGGVYQVEIFASAGDDDGGRGRSSRYQIGSLLRDLDAASNVTGTALFDEVTADASGELVVQVFPTPGSPSRFGQLNALRLGFLSGPDGPLNAAPVVDAGSDQTVFMPFGGSAQATLGGAVIDDGLPVDSEIAVQWSVASAPEGAHVVFANASAPSTAASFDQPGEYVLMFAGDDSQFITEDTVSIAVKIDAGSLGGAVLFSQDFGDSASSDLSVYSNPGAPTFEQFDDLGSTDPNNTWTVNTEGQLEHVRSGGTGVAGFSRYTNGDFD